MKNKTRNITDDRKFTVGISDSGNFTVNIQDCSNFTVNIQDCRNYGINRQGCQDDENRDLMGMDKTISQLLQEITENICNNYCKHRNTSDEECLCNVVRDGGKCPLDRLT